MTGLIYKDFKSIKKLLLFGVAYGVLLAFVQNSAIKEGGEIGIKISIGGFAMFYTVFMTYFSITESNRVDEMQKAHFFINSLPVSKDTVVFSKYLNILFYTFYYFILYIIFSLAVNMINKVYINVFDYKILLITIMINLILFSIQYPLYFKYGNRFLQSSRIIGFFIIFILPKAASKLVNKIIKTEVLSGLLTWIRQNNILVMLMFIILTIVIVITTLNLSIKIYKNKDFV